MNRFASLAIQHAFSKPGKLDVQRKAFAKYSLFIASFVHVGFMFSPGFVVRFVVSFADGLLMYLQTNFTKQLYNNMYYSQLVRYENTIDSHGQT